MATASQRRSSGGRFFRYLRPAKRRPTQYEEVTLHTQWSPKNFAKQGWFSPGSQGRPVWEEGSTRLRAQDWWGYRDPAEQWFRPYVEGQARQEEAIELAVEGAKRSGLFSGLTPAWRKVLSHYYAAYRYLEYGFFLCFCYVQREALSDVVATPLVFEGLDKDRHAQAIALYGMDLEEALPDFSDAPAEKVWLEDPVFQPSRRYVERLLACRDWGEIVVAVNLVFEPLVGTLFTQEFLARFAPHHGDPVTPVIVETAGADRSRHVAAAAELVRFLLEDTPANREVLEEWLGRWVPPATEAAWALAPLFERTEQRPLTFSLAWQRVWGEYRELLGGLGLSLPQEVRL